MEKPKNTPTPKYRAQKEISGSAPLDDSGGWVVVSDDGLLCSNMCEAEAEFVARACNSHDALVSQNKELRESLAEAWDLLYVARSALWKLGLHGRGGDALSHEVRMFALHFSKDEVLQLPFGTKQTGDGRLDKAREACCAALARSA